jgi:site-specific recombinase XerD
MDHMGVLHIRHKTAIIMASIHMLIWHCRSKKSQKGLSPVFLRLTVNGIKTEVSTGIHIGPNQWNSKKGCVRGCSDEAIVWNNKLKRLQADVLKICNDLEQAGVPLSPEGVKNRVLGITPVHRMSLLYALRYHNDLFKEKLGVEKSHATHIKFESLRNKVTAFIRSEYKRSDLFLKELNHQFIIKFEAYLKLEVKIAHNTAMKYIQQLKKIIHLSMAHGWLQQNPFQNLKCTFVPVERGYLTLREIQCILEKRFTVQRLEDVKNVFLFSCYTGLAYSDISTLSQKHYIQKDDGSLWIIMHRRKTGTRSPIPLLPQAQKILNKYLQTIQERNGALLPVISNQKMNAYLKEIGEVCGIEKNLTFHLARHTFATTITLTNGVPIETVSKMLGHTSLKTTQIYAKVVDTKVQEDIKALAAKLAGK